MNYISLSNQDKKEMLESIGVSSVEELFGCIPEAIRLKRPLDLPHPKAELDLVRTIEDVSRKNTYAQYLSFIGAGAYAHFIPAVVDYLSARGEFVSPYTPYQPEVSQGTLQIIFEFQTLICQLTGLDIANASLYEGATGTAEAVLMAQRITRGTKVLLARSLHPQYREVVGTYIKNLGLRAAEIPFGEDGGVDKNRLKEMIDDETCAVVYQSPNFFGICEDVRSLSEIASGRRALSVAVVAEPISLGLLESPGKLGADIVTGEGQSFGIPLSFGGPYLGFMSCRKDYIRQLPGRISGQTVDVDGERGFVLTLATREQHIRRERATSNICTNQALCAVRATIYLEFLGKKGLKEVAWQNAQKANFALEKLTSIPGVRRKFTGSAFNEFVLQFPKPWKEISARLKERQILGGIGLGEWYPELKDCSLVCVTELKKREDIELFSDVIKEILA